MHFRQTIRAELVARATGLPGVVSDPAESVDQVINQKRAPIAVVTMRSEEASPPRAYSTGTDASTRTLQASIVLIAYRPDDLEKLAEEVERRMAAPLMPNVSHRLTGTRFQDPARGEFDFFSLALDYQIEYVLATSDPSRLACDGG